MKLIILLFTILMTISIVSTFSFDDAFADVIRSDGKSGKPTGLTTNTGNAEVLLEWIEPDKNGNSDTTGYKVEYRDTDTVIISSASIYADRCIDVDSSDDNVQMMPCVDSDNQKWTIDGDYIKSQIGNNNKCLTVGDTTDLWRRTNVNVLTCSDSNNQKWTITDNTITSNLKNKCLTILYPISGGDGANVMVEGCSGRHYQTWNVSGDWQTFAEDITDTFVTVTGLTNGQSYDFRVSATNTAGTGDASDTATAIPDGTAPTADITYSETGPYTTDDSITITTTFSEPVKDSPIPQIALSSPNAVSDTDMTKTSSTVYTYSHTVTSGDGTVTVSLSNAEDLAGNAVTSTPTSGATFEIDSTDPTAVITYSATGPYTTDDVITITATFNEPVKDSPIPQISISGSNVLSATNMAKYNSTVYTYSHTVTSGTGTATITLSAAQDTAGNTVTSTPTSGGTFEILQVVIVTVPDTPTGLSATPSDGKVTLEWTAPSNNGGSDITGYKVEYSSDDINWNIFSHTANTATTATITGLINDIEYTFRVFAVNDQGTSTAYDTTTGTPVASPTIPDKPGKPANLQVESRSSSSINVSWEAPQDNGIEIIGYVVKINHDDGAGWIVTRLSSNETSHLYTDLLEGHTYQIFVLTKGNDALDNIVWSIRTDIKEVTTLKIVDVVEPPVTIEKEKSGSGDGNKHKTRPSFGLSHNTFRAEVECGYQHQEVCYDITNNWHTDFEKVEIKVGVPQEIIIKGKFINGIKAIGWGLVPEVGKYHKAEVKIQVYINYSDEIEEVDTYQKHNIIDMDSIIYEYYQEPCGYIDSICDVVKMSNVIFMVEPVFEKIAIHGIDKQNRSHLTFLNEGYDIFGESLNEPLISHVVVSNGGAFYPQDRGVVELTMTSYKNNQWQDVFGHMWEYDYANKIFRIIDVVPVPTKEPDVMWQAMTRINSNFADMIIYEQQRAVLIYDASQYVRYLNPIVEMEIPVKINKLDDPIVLEEMRLAEEYAEKFTKDYTKNQYLYQKDSYNHWNYFGDMTVSQINQFDLEKKLRLQDELYQQRIAEQQKYHPD
jgi:hypothetical protein